MKRAREKQRSGNHPAGRSKVGINDVRAPLMLLYVAAFCGGRLGQVPVWGMLAVAVPALLAVAWLHEGDGIREMLGLGVKPLAAALLVAGALYGMMAGGLHLAASAALERSLAGDGEVPGLFRELVLIRAEVLALGPALAGICGAVLLAPSEEVFWRGFVQQRLGRRLGRWLGVLLGAALHGGFYWILIGPLAAAAAAVTGIACGILVLRHGSLVPAAACRALVWLAAIWLWPLY